MSSAGTPEDMTQKEALVSQILELQNTLEDLSQRVESVRDENIRLRYIILTWFAISLHSTDQRTAFSESTSNSSWPLLLFFTLLRQKQKIKMKQIQLLLKIPYYKITISIVKISYQSSYCIITLIHIPQSFFSLLKMITHFSSNEDF